MKKKLIIFFFILLFILTSFYFYSKKVTTKSLKTNEHKIEVENLPNEYNGLKIIHFSDLHYGTTIKDEEMEIIVTEINNNKPDIVVFTGDLLDSKVELSVEEIDKLSNYLQKIKSNYGKYAIKGDNDNTEKWNNIIETSNFINLNDKYDSIYATNIPILISGISSNTNSSVNIEDKIIPINEYINSLEIKPIYSILLLHEPDYIDKIDVENYNLILAGHSMGGQIKIPIIGGLLNPDGAKKYTNNYYKINNSNLYVSNGLGTNIGIRVLNTPSINMFRIVTKK